MARFLSEEWFAEVEGQQDGPGDVGELVVEQVVTGTPDGEVRYRVSAGPGGARVERVSAAGEADLTFTTDYATASAIAEGKMSAEAALVQGLVRVAGGLRDLTNHADLLRFVDLVPASVRASTTF